MLNDSRVSTEALRLSAQNYALVNKIIAFLQNDRDIVFTQQERDKGTFLHCLILAMIKLEYIQAEQKAEDLIKKEDQELDWKEHIEVARKIHKHHLEDDENLDHLRQKIQSIMACLPTEESKSTKLDPSELLDLREQFQQILRQIDLVQPQNTDISDNPSKAKTKPN